MKTRSVLLTSLFILQASVALAVDESSTPALGGYDPVAYQTENRPVRGSGMFVSKYAGQTYLFATEAHKKRFDRAPAKYVPAYGGWCAYGVSLGKKFHADPTVFAVVDGKTYLNLNRDIQRKWEADRAENIEKAGKAWPRIRSRAMADLKASVR